MKQKWMSRSALCGALIWVASGANADVAFKEGSGVLMDDETRVSLGFEPVDVEERSAGREIWISVQIYREASEETASAAEPAGYAYATGWIPGEQGLIFAPDTRVFLEGAPGETGRVLRVDRAAAMSDGRVEILVQLSDGARRWRIGDFVRVGLKAVEPGAALAVPESAVLDTAYGPVVYVVNGRAYLRTPVELGGRGGGWVSIRDGLFDGDQVVAGPVETLYLIELRATKGGGHGH
ncbi:MAG: hypothetical protein M9935_05935 [Kiritimatiellae bacterium]|nr:hypothetical protein [Kiritimatiellia bacterium]